MKGQTLIEVLVALATAVVVVSAIVVAVISSLNNVSYGRNQNLATQYGQQGMELVRRIRNGNPNFNTYATGEYCLPSGATVLTTIAPTPPSCPLTATTNCSLTNGGISSTFIRRVCIEQNASTCNSPTPTLSPPPTKVRVDVFWSDGRCPASNAYCHSSALASCITNPGTISAP